uniref:Disease resistance protein n=1 Tax=Strongyloides papillosus TaxID=174720 RepID=A0A0N5B5I9_STREA
MRYVGYLNKCEISAVAKLLKRQLGIGNFKPVRGSHLMFFKSVKLLDRLRTAEDFIKVFRKCHHGKYDSESVLEYWNTKISKKHDFRELPSMMRTRLEGCFLRNLQCLSLMGYYPDEYIDWAELLSNTSKLEILIVQDCGLTLKLEDYLPLYSSMQFDICKIHQSRCPLIEKIVEKLVPTVCPVIEKVVEKLVPMDCPVIENIVEKVVAAECVMCYYTLLMHY